MMYKVMELYTSDCMCLNTWQLLTLDLTLLQMQSPITPYKRS